MSFSLLALAAVVGQGSRCEAAPRTTMTLAPITADSGRMFRGTLSADGRTLYYFKKVTPNREDYRIYVTTLVRGKWTAPRQLTLGGQQDSELYPTLSPDGNRLVFSSYRRTPADTFTYQNAHLWYVDRRGDGWGPPVFMAEASTIGHYHSGPMFEADGTVRFNRTTPDWRSMTSLITRWDGTRYGPAEPDRSLDPWRRIRSDLHVWHAKLAPGGRAALLEVARRDPATGRPGPSELWVAIRTGDTWGNPRPLGAGVNTPVNEQFASFTADGCRLIFTRNYSTLHEVGWDHAVADTTAVAAASREASVPVGATTALVGAYRGAFVRNGSVQLVEATIASVRDSLRITLSTPDRIGPVGGPALRVSGDSIGFPTIHGPIDARHDPVFGEIVGTATRGGVTTRLHLKRTVAPAPAFEREDVRFPSSGGVTLAASVVKPVGRPIVAGIVYVPGRGCVGRGFGLRILEALAPYGVAGISIDKRGVGQSTGDCPTATIEQFSDDAAAALERLRTALAGSGARIGFLGVSAGGWVATHAAGRATQPIDFLITSVGPATSVRQQQLDNAALVAKRIGLDPEQTRRALRYVDLMFAKGATQSRYDEMRATVEWAKGVGFHDQFFETTDIPTSVAGLDSLWVQLNDYDPAPVLRRLRIPILAFFGGADEVVPPETNVPALRALAAEAGNDRVRIVVVPEGDHGLTPPDGEAPLGGGTYWRFGRMSPLFLEEVVAFLRRG